MLRKSEEEVEQWVELDAMKDPAIERLIHETREWLPQTLCSIIERFQRRGVDDLATRERVFNRMMRLVRLTVSALNQRSNDI